MGGDAGADARASAGEWRPLLPVVVVLLALFAGWTVRVMVEVGEQRSALETGAGRIQALSALQREAARRLAEEAPRVPDGWQRSTAAAEAVIDELGGASPELADGAAALRGEVIDNACRFTTGGVVEIRAWAEAGGVRVDVRDEGPGMSDADRARAFDPYFQADTSSTRAHDGAGLGLTVAGRICGRLGGTIELQSLRGEGTTVSIWLPTA